ncbi:retrovirus-related pol polyprotein from transposon TNT 1-94 [Tanacetum coccineum]
MNDSELASLFGKLKYEENLIESIYETEKNKSLISAIPLSTAFFSFSIVQDFQDSPDDEEDTRSSQEYLNDLEEEYQQSYFSQSKDSSRKHKPELRPTKDFEAKYNKVKAKLALLSSIASATKASMVKKKGLIAKAYEWDEEEVSSDDNEMVEFFEAEGFILPNHDTSRILPAESQRNTTDPSVAFTDSSATNYDSADESSVCSTPLPPLKKLEGAEPISGPKTIKSILKSKSTLKAEALKGVIINEPSSAPAKGNKSSSTSKVQSAPAGKLKSVKIKYDPSLAIVMKELNSLKLQVRKKSVILPQKCEKTDHRTCDHAEYMSTINMSQHLKSMGRASSRPNIPRPSKCFFPACIHCGGINHLSNECLYYPICKLCGSYDHDTNGHNMIISLEREINPRNPQHAFKRCEVCGSSTHTTTDHYDIEWFKRGEALQAKKAEALKSTRAESSNANRSKTPTKSGCSRHMTGVKSYLHKYVEQSGPKVVFGDDSTCTTEGYGSIKCNGIVFTKVAFVNGLKYNLISISQLCDAKYIVQFDEKRGTIFNSNKEVVMIAPRVRDVYVLDMTSSAQESCFFAKASENLNWLWHKRLAHLNFKTINKLAKQNLVIGLPSLVYSNNKPCSCEKGKHHRASFKIKQTFSIQKCLYLFHMDLFGPVTPRSINHEKYTLVIVDEYSRNNILLNFCDEKGISQNFSSVERKNRTLIEATRTMLSTSVFFKQYWTEAVATTCYTQNRSTIVKRHLKTPYEIFFSSDQNSHNDQNDQSIQNDEILNDDHSEHSNHTNDKQIIDNLPNTKDIQISEHLSSPSVEDTLIKNTIPIPTPSLPIPSMFTPAPQDRWSQDKHIELVNIIGNPGVEMLTRAMAKQLSAASAHECLFVDFLSEEEPKKVSEALKHLGWVDAMQDELNQFARNKVSTLVLAPYGKTIIGSKWVLETKEMKLELSSKTRQDLWLKATINKKA